MYKNLQSFLESTGGQITVIVIMLILFAIILKPNEKSKKVDVKAMTISALMIALSFILSQIKIFSMPQGGSVTLFSMLPIAILAYLLGTKKGVLAGVVLGLLNLVTGPYVIHPVQLLIDYPIAFGAMGMGGFLRDKKAGLSGVYLLGILGRYVAAVISGVVFFGAYAPEKFSPLTWSLWYNITYIAAEGIITLIVINIPPFRKALATLKEKNA